jgi:signal transduction histidine kinase
MTAQSSITPPTVIANRLYGRWLWLAWIGWLYLLLVAVGLIAANLPNVMITTRYSWTIQMARPFVSQWVAFEHYATGMALLKVLVSLVYLLCGLFIFWRKANDWMALFVSATLIGIAPLWGVGGGLEHLSYPAWLRAYAPWVSQHGAMLAWGQVILLFYLFPNGRFAPLWTGWLVGGVIALGWLVHGVTWLMPGWSASEVEWGYFLVVGFPALAIGMGAQIYRYRRCLTVLEQQQVKWVMVGGGLFVIDLVFAFLHLLLVGKANGWSAAQTTWHPLVTMLWPITIALAVARYGLWQVDRLLNRTLVYLVLTGSVALLYGISVSLTSWLSFTQVDLAIPLVAVLAAMGVSLPLHNWLQPLANRVAPVRQPRLDLQPSLLGATDVASVAHSPVEIRIFRWLFALYTLLSLVWLVSGLLPALVALFPAVKALFRQIRAAAVPAWLETLAFGVLTQSYVSEPAALLIFEYLFSLINLPLGVVLVVRRPHDWVARLLAMGMVGTAAIFNLQAHTALSANPLMETLHQWLHFVAGGAYTLALLLFPHGKLPALLRSSQLGATSWRRLGRFLMVLFVFWVGAIFTFDGEPATFVLFFGIVAPVVGISAQLLHWRQGGQAEERRLSYTIMLALGLGLALTLLIGFLAWFLTAPAVELSQLTLRRVERITFFVFPLLYTLIPISLWMIVLRYQLWALDLLINRSLVYGVLTTVVATLYIVVVGFLGMLLQGQGNWLLAVLTTGLIAILFQPLRQRMQGVVNRLLYGQRDEPAEVVSQLGERLAAVATVENAPATLVETVAQALKLPYVALLTQQGAELIPFASYGVANGAVESFPVIYQNETVAWLQSASRSAGETLTPADRTLLARLAQQAAPALHAVRLAADLQQSRERLVTAREEERRRLRRDLHDGLGPQLATLSLQIEAARNLLTRDPTQAGQLLQATKAQMQAAIADVRRVVYNLRSPALDQLGLVSALREQVATVGNNGLRIIIDAPENLPLLPAAVEVAAYRIALEAITNVVRHAKATECRVELQISQTLTLAITDNGAGLPDDYRAGVGILAMRERAGELGGVCTLERGEEGGTRVYVVLPLSLVDI